MIPTPPFLPHDILACFGESEVRGVCPRRESCIRYLGRHRAGASDSTGYSIPGYLCRIPQFAFFWNVHEKA